MYSNTMKSFLKKITQGVGKLVHNPYVDFVLGTILMVSALWDVWETLPQDLSTLNFKTSHGVLIFGIITAIRGIADAFAGLEILDDAEYEDKKDKKIPAF